MIIIGVMSLTQKYSVPEKRRPLMASSAIFFASSLVTLPAAACCSK